MIWWLIFDWCFIGIVLGIDFIRHFDDADIPEDTLKKLYTFPVYTRALVYAAVCLWYVIKWPMVVGGVVRWYMSQSERY